MDIDLFSSFLFLAQAAPPPAEPNLWPSLLMMVLMFAGMWFLIIAPQQKKQKEHQKMLSALKPGEEIITSGGLYGTIVSIKDDRFVVRLGEGVKVELHKGFIHAKVTKEKEK